MKKILTTVFLSIEFALTLYLIYTIHFPSWDFRNNLWAPTYLMTHGESAYNIKSLFADSNAIWFPQVIGVFFFLGFLPQHPATNIWLLLNVTLILILIRYLLQQANYRQIKPIYLGVLILSVFLFPPTIRDLALGQVDILLLTVLIAGVYTLEKRQITLSGFLFAFALVKPQLCTVVFPAIAIYLLFIKKAWRDALKLFLVTCFFAILQTTPLWFSGPAWLGDFWANLQDNPNWAQPNIFSMLLNNKFGTLGLFIWFIIYTIIIIINFQIWSKNTPEKSVIWSLALTAVISPYLWSWDFVFLLPLYIDTTIRLSNTFARLTLFVFYAICFYSTILSLQGGKASDEVLWWFPILLIFGISTALLIDQTSNNKQGSTLENLSQSK